jgi:uncharacterized membrane protein YdjX (TVP38/TMEM64 family)
MAAAGVALVLLLIPFIRNAGDEMIALQNWIGQLGIIGPIVFIAAVVLLTSIFIPFSLLSAVGGTLFGLGWGTCYMSIGMMLAAALNHQMAGRFLQKPITGFLEHLPKLLAMQQAVRSKGWRFQFILRLTPINATSVNYTLGAAGVRLSPYLIACLGAIPGIFAQVYFGHMATHLSKIISSTPPHSMTHIVVTVVGFLVVAGVMVGIGHLAKQTIAKGAAGSGSGAET